ncbi:uncharacterized protein LOC142339507 [Convolutriloba macropyga]|uniref:uncharacterized protein LOC142339507 n=1 Tax=Convolutriloba macropyga TaxID=536237 RepID=UPI003F5243AD
MDRKNNRLCIESLYVNPYGHPSGFHGVQLFITKSHLVFAIDEDVSMNFMFQHRFKRARAQMESLLMCMDLGDEIDSLSREAFISVLELIPLRPHDGFPAVRYPGSPMLCDLDTIEIEKSGCKLVSIKRKPHTCEETQNYDDVVEQYIEPVDIDDVGNSVDEVFPQAEQPTSSFKPDDLDTGNMWTTFELLTSVFLTAVVTICLVIIILFIKSRVTRGKKADSQPETEYQLQTINHQPTSHQPASGNQAENNEGQNAEFENIDGLSLQVYTYDNSSLGSLRPDYPATFPGSDSNEVAISSSQCEQSVQIVDNEGLRDTVETDHKHSTESVVEDSEIQSKEEDPESTDTELERTEREQTESVAVRIGTWVTKAPDGLSSTA